jgi:hypothetical protein
MLPNLPTDNLYKFITLGGLILTTFCLWLFNSALTGRYEALTLLERANLQVDQSTRIMHDAQVNLAKADENAKQPETQQIPATRKANEDDIARLKTELQDALKKNAEILGENSIQVGQLHRQNELLSLMTIVASAGAAVGVILTMVGFGLWYRKHQRYQDEFLVIQVANLRSPVPRPSAASTPPSTTPPEPNQPSAVTP